MRDVSAELMEASRKTPGGWLGVDEVMALGLLGVDIFDGAFELSQVVAINPTTRQARVSNLDKQGCPKLDRVKYEVGTRVVTLKNPRYLH